MTQNIIDIMKYGVIESRGEAAVCLLSAVSATAKMLYTRVARYDPPGGF